MEMNNAFVFYKVDDETKPIKIDSITDIIPDEDSIADEDSSYRHFLTTREYSCNVQIDPADMRKLDILFRPYVIFCNPKDELLFEEYKKNGFVIHPTLAVGEGKYLIIDRRELEAYDN